LEKWQSSLVRKASGKGTAKSLKNLDAKDGELAGSKGKGFGPAVPIQD
jgi:hypothetical protein